MDHTAAARDSPRSAETPAVWIWRWPSEPSWFYAGADVLAFVGPNGPLPSGPTDRFDVFLGSRARDALAYLRDLEDIDWARAPE